MRDRLCFAHWPELGMPFRWNIFQNKTWQSEALLILAVLKMEFLVCRGRIIHTKSKFRGLTYGNRF